MKKTILLSLIALASLGAKAQKSPEEKLNMTMYAIMNMYVDSIKKAPFVDAQIAQMLRSLDPFSEYLPPVAASSNEKALLGKPAQAGIGIEGNVSDGRFYVTYVSPGTDAHAKGLRGGDEITLVDGVKVGDINDGVYAKINGDAGSSVNLTVRKPDGKEQAVTVKRGFIAPSTVRSHYMVDRHTGYVCLSMFSETTVADFKKAIAELRKQGMKNLVLDLQGNGGGLFDAAVALADEFIDGTKTIVSTKGAHNPSETWRAKNKGFMESGRIVLLVGKRTMSAAEIFSGAIRDWDRGVLVGSTTFGKGLIQQTLPFDDGSALRLTVARYVTPSGMNIQRPYAGHEQQDTAKVYKSMLNHRTLRGGGGITADISVLPDTSYLTRWYGYITYSGVQKVAARNYIISHRQSLLGKYRKPDAFIASFDTPNELLQGVRQLSESAGIPFDEDGYSRSLPYLCTQLKALMARDLYADNNLYYKIINSCSPVLRKAVSVIEGKEYDEVLSK